MSEEDTPTESTSWFARLKQGLSKSSQQLSEGITSLFTKRKLDQPTLDELEELLIRADMGAATAAKITAALKRDRFEKDIESQELHTALAQEVAKLLEPVACKLPVNENRPHVVLVVGVNGNGKTTTIGKLAKRLQEEGRSVMLCAADTFRAAAVEQLQIWGQRNNVPVITAAQEADPASVAFTALEKAKQAGTDVLLIDTAGRLQNKTNLMFELQKMVKVIKKQDATAPHTVLQILDATTGQNALSQVKLFQEAVNVTGLVVTKLDGTAKGGIIVALAEQFKLPIYAIGVGEGIDDLRDFTASDFAENLVGIKTFKA